VISQDDACHPFCFVKGSELLQFEYHGVVAVGAGVPGDPVSLLVDGEGHVRSVGEGVDLGHHRVESVEADPALDLVGVPVEDDLVADLVPC